MKTGTSWVSEYVLYLTQGRTIGTVVLIIIHSGWPREGSPGGASQTLETFGHSIEGREAKEARRWHGFWGSTTAIITGAKAEM